MKNFVRTQGNRLVVGDANDELHLRGVAIYKSDRPEPSPQDYEELASLHVNTIRLTFSYHHFYNEDTPEVYKEEAWRWIDAHVTLAHQYQMRLILQNCGVEGAQFVPIADLPFDYTIWVNTELQNRFINLWRAIAERYQNEPQIVGFSLFYEPVVLQTKEQWRDLAQRTINAIREVDQNHIVFVERVYGENAVRREVSNVELTPEEAFVSVQDDKVIYEFYFFERDEFTHQFAPWRTDVQTARIYPDEQWQIYYRERSGLERYLPFNRDYLKFYLDRQREFGRAQNTPMAIWAFGALKSCYTENRGGLQWLKDVLELFNQQGVHWTLWGYYDDDFGIHANEAAKAILKSALENSA
ncbi:MAG TPA: cellulase family glycosylhydrolase [Anaerolineales bacterium]